ncbi:MAG: hypothetical protein HYU36_01610 [Planctomycetes bacterium]|nr:hypothetical protein [Planctomycetota bacterium]
MNPEARQSDDYSARQVEAARRVLVDVGQVLAQFEDGLVIVGGWVPDLLLTDAEEPHIGSNSWSFTMRPTRMPGRWRPAAPTNWWVNFSLCFDQKLTARWSQMEQGYRK